MGCLSARVFFGQRRTRCAFHYDILDGCLAAFRPLFACRNCGSCCIVASLFISAPKVTAQRDRSASGDGLSWLYIGGGCFYGRAAGDDHLCAGGVEPYRNDLLQPVGIDHYSHRATIGGGKPIMTNADSRRRWLRLPMRLHIPGRRARDGQIRQRRCDPRILGSHAGRQDADDPRVRRKSAMDTGRCAGPLSRSVHTVLRRAQHAHMAFEVVADSTG